MCRPLHSLNGGFESLLSRIFFVISTDFISAIVFFLSIRNMYLQHGHFNITNVIKQRRKIQKIKSLTKSLLRAILSDYEPALKKKLYFPKPTCSTGYPSLIGSFRTINLLFYKKPKLWNIWQFFPFQFILLRNLIKIF